MIAFGQSVMSLAANDKLTIHHPYLWSYPLGPPMWFYLDVLYVSVITWQQPCGLPL